MTEPIKLKFGYDLSKADFQIDALQNQILQSYIRLDPVFRKAFYTDFTAQFFQFLKDKANLKEPIYISCQGNVRGGKSSSMISVMAFLNSCFGKTPSVKYICANGMEFLEKIKTFQEEETTNCCFLIDEEKMALFGVGSVSKKTKATDIMNIIAKRNVSIISINPVRFANEDGAFYGLRAFGRDFNQKLNRFMLYNLQEAGNHRPLGLVYIPTYNVFLPKEIAEPLEHDYIKKKDEWISREMAGESDSLSEIRRKYASKFVDDEIFKQIKKKNEKVAYISAILGSEWTKGEIDDIYNLTSLMEKGFIKKVEYQEKLELPEDQNP